MSSISFQRRWRATICGCGHGVSVLKWQISHVSQRFSVLRWNALAAVSVASVICALCTSTSSLRCMSWSTINEFHHHPVLILNWFFFVVWLHWDMFVLTYVARVWDVRTSVPSKVLFFEGDTSNSCILKHIGLQICVITLTYSVWLKFLVEKKKYIKIQNKNH